MSYKTFINIIKILCSSRVLDYRVHSEAEWSQVKPNFQPLIPSDIFSLKYLMSVLANMKPLFCDFSLKVN